MPLPKKNEIQDYNSELDMEVEPLEDAMSLGNEIPALDAMLDEEVMGENFDLRDFAATTGIKLEGHDPADIFSGNSGIPGKDNSDGPCFDLS